MNILHLNLVKKWFNMILSEEKLEEYREIKPYWDRVFLPNNKIKIKGKYYDPWEVTICFSNGYSTNRDQLLVPLKNHKIGKGKDQWGAVPNKFYHVLILGKPYLINKK